MSLSNSESPFHVNTPGYSKTSSPNSKNFLLKSANTFLDEEVISDDLLSNDNYSCYFEDGIRKVDFILAFSKNDHLKDSLIEARKIFEANLIEEGLHLERISSNDNDLDFVLIHAPFDVLCRYAELMKLKMPMKPIETSWRMLLNDENPYAQGRFNAPFQLDKYYLFHIPQDKDKFFSSSQRSQIVDFILKRKSYLNSFSSSASGLTRLLNEGTYKAIYPLHEGQTIAEHKDSPRMKLLKNWASLTKIFNAQPLNDIRRYFGVKIAMYFAWLGFYTLMLIPASIVGLGCFLYGVFTLSQDKTVAKICNGTYDEYPMCPLCRMSDCGYWYFSSSCTYSKVLYLFDNPATVFFAVFMSLWATVYLEMWKRYSSRITHRWDLSNFDNFDEYPRPEYLLQLKKAKKKSLNLITKMYEPYVPFWKTRFPLQLASGSVVFFLILIALASVIGVIIFRVSFRAALSVNPDPTISKYSSFITSACAAIINLVCIMFLNALYTRIALKLTKREIPRTQTDFDNSLTLKMYLLQFVNYYSSIFYIAFFKGRFSSYPGDLVDNGSFTAITQEECGSGRCLVELTIQLAIIMVGKQALNAVQEMSFPWFEWCYKRWTSRLNEKSKRPLKQWESDYLLAEWKPQSLFYEYLEMVLQFGFVTIFVVAFPLAPMFALINNAMEIRLDAKKMIISLRRSVAIRVKNIGVWYRILDGICKLSLITNACVIAFSSQFIPKLYHYYKYGDTKDYFNSTLSYYNSSLILHKDMKSFIHPKKSKGLCMYEGSSSSINSYLPTKDYYELMCYRLLFIILFENIIAFFTMTLRWAIPDIPRALKVRIKQQDYLTNELIMQKELKKTHDLDDGRIEDMN